MAGEQPDQSDTYQYSEHRPTFSLEERDRRWGLVREQMFNRGIDCLIVWGTDRAAGMGRANLRYLTQIPGQSKIQHAIGLFPLHSDPIVWSGIPHMHKPFNFYDVYQDWVDDSRTFEGIDAIAEEIEAHGHGDGRLGIVGVGSIVSQFNIPHRHYEEFQKALPRAEFLDCTDMVQRARMIKSDEEIEKLRKAGDIANKMARALLKAEPGMKECEVYAEMIYEQIANGGEGYVFNMLDSGSTSDGQRKHLLHGKNVPLSPSTRTLEADDVIITEYHGNWGGNLVAGEKSVFLGDPPEELQAIHEVCLQCQENAMENFYPGTRLEDLWEAIRAPVKEADMDFVELGFHGHGLGSPEYPSTVYPQEPTETYPEGLAWNALSGYGLEDMQLRPGMVFGTNIDVHDPSWRKDIGLMYGDTVLVTEDGPEKLIDMPTQFSV